MTPRHRRAIPAGARWLTFAGALAVVAVATAAESPGDAGASAGAPGGLRVVQEIRLPPLLRWSQDIRWLNDTELALGSGRQGVYRLDLRNPSGIKRLVPPTTFRFPVLIAVSGDRLVAGAPFRPLGWITLAGSAQHEAQVGDASGLFAGIFDLDLADDRLFVLGTRRDEQGVWSADGALAWTGSLSKQLFDLRPVHFESTGPGAVRAGRCSSLVSGALRATGNGGFVVAPGFDPGVFRYDRDGKLVRAWQTDGLGFDDRCDLEAEEADVLGRLPRSGFAWRNARTLLDELVLFGDVPALVLREPHGQGVRWRMVLLEEKGSRSVELPLSSSSSLSHIRIDRRGERLAVLVLEHGLLDEPPQAPPRVVILEGKP